MLDCRYSRWWPPKLEMYMAIEWRSCWPDSNCYPHIWVHAELVYVTAGIARHSLIIGNQDSGHHLRFRLRPSWISLVAQRRTMSVVSRTIQTWSRMRVEVGIVSLSAAFQKVIFTFGLLEFIFISGDQPTRTMSGEPWACLALSQIYSTLFASRAADVEKYKQHDKDVPIRKAAMMLHKFKQFIDLHIGAISAYM